MYCKECGKKLRETAKFCSGCGKEIAFAETLSPKTADTSSAAQSIIPPNIAKVRCINGHYFDRNRMSVCPECGAKMAEAVQPAANPKDRWREKLQRLIGRTTPTAGGDAKTVSLDIKPKKEEGHTAYNDGIGSPATSAETDASKVTVRMGEKDNQDVYTRKLRDQIDSSMGWTDDEANKTIGRYHTEMPPVVGWLICLKGEHQGEGFPLKEGQNNVGRSQSMDVVLKRESSVSREKHIIITYEPKKGVFYAQQGESLSYLNNEPILVPKELKPYDQLQMGESIYMFYPLCSEKFTWDDYIEVED